MFGSARGLRQEVHSVWSRSDLGLRPVGDESTGSLTTGDLDDDGFPEIMTVVVGAQEPRDPLVVQIAWGTATGPVEKARSTALTVLPAGKGAGRSSIATGDFDGDGRHDLAILYAPPAGKATLEVWYGPFARDGSAARQDSRPAAEGSLVADGIGAKRDRPADLLVQHENDGGQSPNTLFTGGPRGLAKTGVELRAGNGHAFGDFDGDGRRDVAIADDGSRNDEPGYETEPPTVEDAVNVHYARDFAKPQQIRVPGIRDGLAAADTDGDGRDELGLNLGPDSGVGAPGGSTLGGSTPGAGTPGAGTPGGGTPGAGAPGAGAPGAGAPGAGAPGAGTPGIGTSGMGTSGAGTPGGGMPGGGTPGGGTPGAGSPGVPAPAPSTATIGALAVTIGPNGPERQVSLRHTMPATVDGVPVPPEYREARVLGAGDFDGDGRGEFVLSWEPDDLGRYRQNPRRWWITDGVRDKTAFTTATYRD